MVTVFVLLKLPSIFTNGGATAEEAALQTYGIVGGIVVVTAVLMYIGLKGGKPDHHEFDASIKEQLIDGFTAASDAGIRLAYAASFVARGNLAVVGTFFVLWTTN